MPKQVFSADESALLQKKKKPQTAFISKEEKRAPEFKAGRESTTLLVCANAARCITKTALTYKAACLLITQQEGLDTENPFSGLVPSMFCP